MLAGNSRAIKNYPDDPLGLFCISALRLSRKRWGNMKNITIFVTDENLEALKDNGHVDIILNSGFEKLKVRIYKYNV